MSSPRFASAQANSSCQRCHGRKKKCDKALPQCGNCQQAQVTCSFLSNENQVGSYSVAFVQSLEAKIQNLEAELVDLREGSRTESNEGTESQSVDRYVDTQLQGLTTDAADASPSVQQSDVVSPHAFGRRNTFQSQATPRASCFQDELRLLSLQAAAERHLGSSSGLSFAKLTQMILRRLSPDKAEFVFDSIGQEDMQQRFDLSSPLDALNSIVNDFSVPLTRYPAMFADSSEPTLPETESILAGMALPESHYIKELANFYFAHSHTLYPIIQQEETMTIIEQICVDPEMQFSQSPIVLFRIWMILAIASTAYCSVKLVDESESMIYYDKAMLYFETALGYGDIAALEALTLQVSYSFFNQLGPNTWFLVGLAARMAVGLGLHNSSTYTSLSTQVAESRKRIFFCIYMMDRVVSIALGRPFAIHDDDIDVIPFSDANRGGTNSEESESEVTLQPSVLAIPVHILALRKIASKIVKQVYQSSSTQSMSLEDAERRIRSLHKELIDWRRSMPFPLPDLHPNVPHLSSNWYDFNFYTHLTMLYRPSPLSPRLDLARVRILADAASMSIRLAINMHRQQRFAHNWLNLLSIFTSTISLIYAITAQPDDLATTLRQSKAIDDLDHAIELFSILGTKFSAAQRFRIMFEEIANKYKTLLGIHSSAITTFH